MNNRRMAVVCALAAVGAPAARAGRVSPGLAARLRSAPSGAPVRAIAYLRPGAPVASGPHAIRSLQPRARATQTPVLRFLSGRARGRVVSLWVVNAVALEATPATLRALAARADIDVVVEDPLFHRPLDPGSAGRKAAQSSWNVAKIRADLLWGEGTDGSGVRVGVIDTGVDITHPQLAGKMAPGGWFDAVGNAAAPYDDNGHGTHVTGIVCGGAPDGPRIGVAPGARFLSAKALDAGNRFFGSWVLAAGQWMADPNHDGSAADAPAIVSCSWSFNSKTTTFYRPVLTLWRSQGIWPVFAAGNSGPSAYSVGAPASDPLAIGVGSTNSGDAIATSSGRGPAPTPAPYNNRLKPDVCAPGVSISSTVPGGGMESWSGTSMATPHVAGALALLRQRFPALSFEGGLRRLTETAVDLGSPGPDAAYGNGRIDAYAAVHMAEGYVAPSLYGVVKDADGAPVRDALVSVSTTLTTTGMDGRFLIPHVATRNHGLTIDAPGFLPATLTAVPNTETPAPLTARVEPVVRNGAAAGTIGWTPDGDAGGFGWTPALSRALDGTGALEVTAMGDGRERRWLSPRVPVPMGAPFTVNATYAWRATGNANVRVAALLWLDGRGAVLKTDYGTPFDPPWRGGEADGVWRVEVPAFRAAPPANAAWVRLALGAAYPAGDTASRMAFDDAGVDIVPGFGTGALTGIVTRNGAPVEGAVVGAFEIGGPFALTDATGRYVLVSSAAYLSLAAWEAGALPSFPMAASSAVNLTLPGPDFALAGMGTDAAAASVASASSSRDAASQPANAVDASADTLWSSDAPEVATPDNPVWLQLDMGTVRTVRAIETLWEVRPSAGRLQTSTDGLTWTEAYAGGVNGWTQAAGQVLNIVRLPDTPARYVRVESLQNDYPGRIGVWDVRVLAAPAVPRGDLDENGVVDAADALLALRWAGGLEPRPHGDGTALNMADAVDIARRARGLGGAP